jgi:sulfur carrier protein ThiS
MRETLTSTRALAATMPPVREADPNVVPLRILYNPFDAKSVEAHELEWRPDTTLADYLEGLPEEAEWMIFHNDEEVEIADAASIPVEQGDRIGLVMLPLKGDGLKNLLRLAIVAVAFAFAGPLGAMIATAGLMIFDALLMKPKQAKNQDDGRSYGIDGAKNSATEGIPYPVAYGEFRVAGNFADCYTENVGDNQYLYLRTVLNDGLIEGVYDIEVNEQPITNFRDIQTRIKLGTLTEDVNDWFGRSIVQKNKGIKLDTGWTTHITSQPIDMVRFDVMFPQGLVDIKEKDGSYRNRSVTFQTQYRRVDPITKQPVAGSAGQWTTMPTSGAAIERDLNGDGDVSFSESLLYIGRMSLAAKAGAKKVADTTTPPAAVEYRQVGSGSWSTFGEIPNNELAGRGFAFNSPTEAAVGSGGGNITPYVSGEWEMELPAGNYEFRGVNGAQITHVASYPTSGSGSFTVTDKRTRQIRRSFESIRLEKGYYEVAIRRTSAQSTDQYKIDEVHLTDVAEIECDPVALRGTANLSLRIKLTEQLNQIPGLTARIKASVVQKYDIEGNPTVKEWSNNPAWIGLDILCGIERGAGIPLWRIDWPAWIAFAEHCEANNITFNGVFDTGTNMGDALDTVLRVAHATKAPFGAKMSVVVDKPRAPVTAFTSAGIVEKTFQVAYLSMQDRANEFEVTFYDKLDRNKAKAIRYVDPKAVTFNEMPRKVSVTLPGVDNIDQATRELWRLIYSNRLLNRTLSFEAWMEAINLSFGEVALIQHDMMEWANNGRLKDGCTATRLVLDQEVSYDETPHAVLVHFSAMNRGSRQAQSIVGKRVMVTGASVASLSAKRLLCNGEDYEIVTVQDGGSVHTITLDRAPTAISVGATVELWDTDVLEERAVSAVSVVSGASFVELATPLSGAPAALSNFIYGRVTKVKKPYVLTGASGNGIEKRRLTFVEYNEGVYGPPEVDIPVPVETVSDRQVGQVQALLFDYEELVPANTRVINARVHWNAGRILNYGGADVYMALNGGPFRAVGSVQNVSEMLVQLTPGDDVEFKVVAYNKRGDRSAIVSAPTVKGTIAVRYATLDAPTGFAATNVAFQVDGKAQFAWTPPADATGIENYEVQYRLKADATWTSLGYFRESPTEVAGLPTGTYVGRVRASSSTSTSVWVEDEFIVVVAPGSLMANWTSSNDRNGNPIAAPTLPATNAVEHTLNRDGSANISFEWEWSGDEATIDGFLIEIEQTPPA